LTGLLNWIKKKRIKRGRTKEKQEQNFVTRKKVLTGFTSGQEKKIYNTTREN
jgi:hypothetical protein